MSGKSDKGNKKLQNNADLDETDKRLKMIERKSSAYNQQFQEIWKSRQRTLSNITQPVAINLTEGGEEAPDNKANGEKAGSCCIIS